MSHENFSQGVNGVVKVSTKGGRRVLSDKRGVTEEGGQVEGQRFKQFVLRELFVV